MQFNLLETNKNQFPKILIAACIVVLAACAPVSDNTAV